MSYSGLGADSMPWFKFTTRADGARFFDDESENAILSMLEMMYVGPQVPAVDTYGQRIILTPGTAPGLPTGRQYAVTAARAGWTVLALETFSPTINQALRFTNDPSLLADLTNPDGQAYAIVLTPDTAQSMSPMDTGPVSNPNPTITLPDGTAIPIPAQLPDLSTLPTILGLPGPSADTSAPVPASSSPAATSAPVVAASTTGGAAPAASAPSANKAGISLFGMTQNQTLLVGAGAVALLILVATTAKSSEPAKARR